MQQDKAPAKKKRVLKKVAPAMHKMPDGKLMKGKHMAKKPMLGQYP